MKPVSRSSGGSRNDRRSGSRLGAFLLGFLCAFLLSGLGLWSWLKLGKPPVAVSDHPLPYEAQIVHAPLGARIDRELEQPPFGTSEDVFETGAKIYVKSCAACHGTPGKASPFAHSMYPAAPQLWKQHPHGTVVGVSDDQPGETYWKVKNGIRLTGMPAFQSLYTPAQIWDVSLLLKNADQPLPDPVLALLHPQLK